MTIDHDIPIPPKQTTRKYPLDELDIGDSFFVRSEPDEQRSLTMTLASSIKAQTKRTGWRSLHRLPAQGSRAHEVVAARFRFEQIGCNNEASRQKVHKTAERMNRTHGGHLE